MKLKVKKLKTNQTCENYCTEAAALYHFNAAVHSAAALTILLQSFSIIKKYFAFMGLCLMFTCIFSYYWVGEYTEKPAGY